MFNCPLNYPSLLEGLASLEAKRKFSAPKVTPKQQILNESSLSSPQSEDSSTPDSIEDTSLPTNNIQASQCSSEHFSSEPPQDDSINAASQCISENFSCEFHRDDSASVSPQCSSRDIGSDPPLEDQGIEDTKVEVNYCNRSTIPAGSCLERKFTGIAEPFLVSHNTEPSRPVPHYTESNVVPTNRNIIVRSSYFKTVNKRVYTYQGENELDDEDNYEAGNCGLSGDQLRNLGGILKRRKFYDLQNFEDETLQPTSSHESPPVVDEGWQQICHPDPSSVTQTAPHVSERGCDTDTDTLDGINTNAKSRFECNVSHVNIYSGIAEKSTDKFATLISSFRYAGSRASGLRAPLKYVKNTLSVRSVLRPPEQKFSCTAKKTARGPPSQSSLANDATNTADGPPDLSAFAYRPMKTAVLHPDQGKITNRFADAPTRSTVSRRDQSKSARKATCTDGSPPYLSTFAYTPKTTVGHSNRSKFSSTVVGTADSPSDLSTFAYKPMKTAVR